MHNSNHRYGHANVLARYAGRSGGSRVWGYVQHGWNIGTGFPDNQWLAPGVPRFVWSTSVLDRARRAGLGNVVAIGAPFLYLLRLQPDDRGHRSGTLVYPFHAWEGSDVAGDHAAHADEIRATEGGDATVCLHWFDFQNPMIRQAYEGVGLRVICHGPPNSPDFLYRQLRAVRSHARVVTNRLQTALWYAAACGREVGIYGPVMGERTIAEGERAIAMHREHWRDMYQDPVPAATAATLAAAELGEDCVLDPQELRHALGWTGVKWQLRPILGALDGAARVASRVRHREGWAPSYTSHVPVSERA